MSLSPLSSKPNPIATGIKYLAFGAGAVLLFLLLAANPPWAASAGGLDALADVMGNPIILIPTLALLLLALNEAFFHFLAGALAFAAKSGAGKTAPYIGPLAIDKFHAGFKALFFLFLVSPIFMAKRYLFYYYEWPLGESFRYTALTRFFREAILAGVYYPRWLPDLFYGYGYPTFLFYPPGYFYFSSAFRHGFGPLAGWLGFPIDVLLLDWITATAVILIGAMGAYLLCAYSGGGKYGAICALLFLLSPYLMVNLQYRGDMAELFSMALLPYPFYFLFKIIDLAKEGSKMAAFHSLLLALTLGLIFISHPATALLFSFIFFAYGAFLILLERREKEVFIPAGILFIAAFGLGLAISSPYWLHVFLLKSLVNLHAARLTHYDVSNWSAQIGDFFRTSQFSSNFYQLGLPHFVLASLGAWMNRGAPRIWGAYLIYLSVIILLTKVGTPVWSYFDLVRYIQFPWRIQTALATLQIICIGGLFSAIINGRRNWMVYLVYPALAFTFYWSLDHFFPRDREVPHLLEAEMDSLIDKELANKDMRKNTWTNTVEFAPNHALLLKHPITEETKSIEYPWQHTPVKMKPAFRPAHLAQLESGKGSLHPMEGNGKHRIQYEADIKETARVRVNQVYFPGWSVMVDGKRIGDGVLWANAGDEAIIKFDVEPGVHKITAFYEGPPHWEMRNAAIIAICVLYILFSALAAWRYIGRKNGLNISFIPADG